MAVKRMRIGLLTNAPASLAAVMQCIEPTDEAIRFELNQSRFAASNLTQADLNEAGAFLWRVAARKAPAAEQSRLMAHFLGDDWRTRYRIPKEMDPANPIADPVRWLAMAFIRLRELAARSR